MRIDMGECGENERVLFVLVRHLLQVYFEGTDADKTAAKGAVASFLNGYPKEKREEMLLTAMWWAEELFAEEQVKRPHSH